MLKEANGGQMPAGYGHFSNLHEEMDQEDIAQHAQRLKRNRIFDDEEDENDLSPGSCSDGSDDQDGSEGSMPTDESEEEGDSDIDVDLDSQGEYFNESDQSKGSGSEKAMMNGGENLASPGKHTNGDSEIHKFAQEAKLAEKMEKLQISDSKNSKGIHEDDKENVEIEQKPDSGAAKWATVSFYLYTDIFHHVHLSIVICVSLGVTLKSI